MKRLIVLLVLVLAGIASSASATAATAQCSPFEGSCDTGYACDIVTVLSQAEEYASPTPEQFATVSKTFYSAVALMKSYLAKPTLAKERRLKRALPWGSGIVKMHKAFKLRGIKITKVVATARVRTTPAPCQADGWTSFVADVKFWVRTSRGRTEANLSGDYLVVIAGSRVIRLDAIQ